MQFLISSLGTSHVICDIYLVFGRHSVFISLCEIQASIDAVHALRFGQFKNLVQFDSWVGERYILKWTSCVTQFWKGSQVLGVYLQVTLGIALGSTNVWEPIRYHDFLLSDLRLFCGQWAASASSKQRCGIGREGQFTSQISHIVNLSYTFSHFIGFCQRRWKLGRSGCGA